MFRQNSSKPDSSTVSHVWFASFYPRRVELDSGVLHPSLPFYPAPKAEICKSLICGWLSSCFTTAPLLAIYLSYNLRMRNKAGEILEEGMEVVEGESIIAVPRATPWHFLQVGRRQFFTTVSVFGIHLLRERMQDQLVKFQANRAKSRLVRFQYSAASFSILSSDFGSNFRS